jgi:hypothetical protein
MDLGDAQIESNSFEIGESKPRKLPPDLPTSLNDRRQIPPVFIETEVYDGWQGGTQLLPQARAL